MPPIRNTNNSEVLWDELAMGLFDVLASGHHFIDPEYKDLKEGNFKKALPGITCLGFTLQAMWTVIRSKVTPD